jgi:hypothetical protein
LRKGQSGARAPDRNRGREQPGRPRRGAAYGSAAHLSTANSVTPARSPPRKSIKNHQRSQQHHISNNSSYFA